MLYEQRHYRRGDHGGALRRRVDGVPLEQPAARDVAERALLALGEARRLARPQPQRRGGGVCDGLRGQRRGLRELWQQLVEGEDEDLGALQVGGRAQPLLQVDRAEQRARHRAERAERRRAGPCGRLRRALEARLTASALSPRVGGGGGLVAHDEPLQREPQLLQLQHELRARRRRGPRRDGLGRE